MRVRVLTEVADRLIAEHQAPRTNTACECFRCRSLRDLLDARRDLASKDKEIAQLKAKVQGLMDAGDLVADRLAATLAKR